MELKVGTRYRRLLVELPNGKTHELFDVIVLDAINSDADVEYVIGLGKAPVTKARYITEAEEA